jgi:hypothetical protein
MKLQGVESGMNPSQLVDIAYKFYNAREEQKLKPFCVLYVARGGWK